MDSRRSELLESVVHQLIDEEALGVCFEMHRAIRLGYYELLYPEDNVYEKQEIVDVKGMDIFGNTPHIMKKQVDCICPNCERSLGALKFAPHLEKCMGMGRNSSRLATKKQKTSPDSDQDASEDNEDEWTYPERKAPKKLKKDKVVSSSPRRPGGRGPGRPPKHPRPEPPETSSAPDQGLKMSLQHNVASFTSLSSDQKQTLLRQMCAVVSERTGRLCTRSTNCPQHTEEQKSEVRRYLLSDRRGDVIAMPPAKRLKESSHKYSDVSDDIDIEGQYGLSSAPQPSTAAPLVSSNPGRKRKVKSSKRSKKGHGSGGPVRLAPPEDM